MAITAEQAAAISTAIENLNKSVQVNEEVLQIIKSMQSTGAAGSVAEHAANVHAHEQLDKFVIPNVFFVGQDIAYVDDKAAMRERQKFCVHGIIGARQTGASNEHEHQTQFS